MDAEEFSQYYVRQMWSGLVLFCRLCNVSSVTFAASGADAM